MPIRIPFHLLRVIIIAVLLAIVALDMPGEPVPQHNSALTGGGLFAEVMASDSAARFHDMAHMKKETFLDLLHILETNGGLESNLTICSGQKLMIFLSLLVGNSYRNAADRWQHSTSTITMCTTDVINAFDRIGTRLWSPPSIEDHEKLRTRRYRHFQGCLGALDGTMVSACVPTDIENYIAYRNRKGHMAQNVLGVVNFDMCFIYVLAGWEGSAHDGKVLRSALDNGFSVPPGKYYLGDAGYALTDYCLTPYRGVRYHLKEWNAVNMQPQNKEELFNLRHSTLRNVVERTFGIY